MATCIKIKLHIRSTINGPEMVPEVDAKLLTAKVSVKRKVT